MNTQNVELDWSSPLELQNSVQLYMRYKCVCVIVNDGLIFNYLLQISCRSFLGKKGVMLQFDFFPAPPSVTLKGGEELSRGFVGQITHSVVSKRNAHIL